MLISVIIPVYNVEKYLRRCVESVMLQTYKDIEILLIDDGSTDRSGRICDELAHKDIRIHVFHKENGGVSSARNLGIERACGEYICFVDSDDWIDIDYFESAMPILEKEHPRLLMNNYVKDDGCGLTSCKFPSSPTLYFDEQEAFYEMVNGTHFGWEPFASFYEAISCKRVKFDSHIVFGEDLLFRFQFTQINKGLYIYQYLPKYHYFNRMSSAVNSYAIYKKVDDLKVLKRIMAMLDERTEHLLFHCEYVPRLVHYYLLGIHSMDYRDVHVANELQMEIKKNIWYLMKDDSFDLVMKLKLIFCLPPKSMIRPIWWVYQKVKNHLL